MLTRFERARVIGARALQISMGAPVLVEVTGKVANLSEIVLKEIKEGVLPLTIVREYPNGQKELMNVTGENFG